MAAGLSVVGSLIFQGMSTAAFGGLHNLLAQPESLVIYNANLQICSWPSTMLQCNTEAAELVCVRLS